ncbi:hypothetical protein AKJ41_06290, partial [candidate division MSBL1 archaeon SCGC-AAA259O05]
GIDGGGSETTAAISTLEGEIIGFSKEGPSRLETIGEKQAEETIEVALKGALTQTDAELSDVKAACLGFGGLDTEKARQRAMRIAANILPDSCTFSVRDDATVGLHSGTFGEPGIAIVAGTGALLKGINEGGREERVDGWGHLFGDLGSAYYIGKEGIRAMLEDFDGRGKETILFDLIGEEYDLESPPDALDYFHGRKKVPAGIAGVARLVDEAAGKGDEVAENILKSASEELERSAVTLIDNLKMGGYDPLNIVLIGGAFNSDILRKNLRTLLSSRYENARLIRPDHPEVGAVFLALEATDVVVDDRIIENLRQSTKEVKKFEKRRVD